MKPVLYDTCYPGSMSESRGGRYIRRDDIPSLLAALAETIEWQKAEIADLKAMLPNPAIHAELLHCINSYLMDSLTAQQARDYINEVEVVPIVNYGDWRDYVPVNLRFRWRELPEAARLGVALMAMGTVVGAIGRPRSLGKD